MNTTALQNTLHFLHITTMFKVGQLWVIWFNKIMEVTKDICMLIFQRALTYLSPLRQSLT